MVSNPGRIKAMTICRYLASNSVSKREGKDWFAQCEDNMVLATLASLAPMGQHYKVAMSGYCHVGLHLNMNLNDATRT